MHCASVPNANKVVPKSVDVGVAVDVRGPSGSRGGLAKGFGGVPDTRTGQELRLPLEMTREGEGVIMTEPFQLRLQAESREPRICPAKYSRVDE